MISYTIKAKPGPEKQKKMNKHKKNNSLFQLVERMIPSSATKLISIFLM